jgi:hypothetical protein
MFRRFFAPQVRGREKFAAIFAGFSLGSNDLTQLVLGVDSGEGDGPRCCSTRRGDGRPIDDRSSTVRRRARRASVLPKATASCNLIVGGHQTARGVDAGASGWYLPALWVSARASGRTNSVET